MGEAVHLHVPMLSLPIEGQYEQELNARYLRKLGYGLWSRKLKPDQLIDFVKNSDDYSHSLESYKSQDNGMLYSCVDELLRMVELDEPRPECLRNPAMGHYEGPTLPDGV